MAAKMPRMGSGPAACIADTCSKAVAALDPSDLNCGSALHAGKMHVELLAMFEQERRSHAEGVPKCA